MIAVVGGIVVVVCCCCCCDDIFFLCDDQLLAGIGRIFGQESLGDEKSAGRVGDG